MTVTGAQAVWFITVGRVNLRYALSCGVSIRFFFPPFLVLYRHQFTIWKNSLRRATKQHLANKWITQCGTTSIFLFFFYSLVLAHGEVIKQDEGFIISARDADQFWPHVSWGRIV